MLIAPHPFYQHCNVLRPQIFDKPDPGESKTFDSEALAYVLVGISIACIVSQILITIFIDCGLWDCMTNKKSDGEGGTCTTTKVVPTSTKQQQINNNAKKAWSAATTEN